MNIGVLNLRDVSDTPQERVWAAPLWENLAFLALLAMMIWAAASIWHIPEEWLADPDSPWRTLFQWAGVILLAVAAVIVALRMIHRGRLVLNRDERLLYFYYILFWPRAGRQLRLDDIVSLKVRDADAPGVEEGSPGTHRIVVAELRDGRLASIAFDSAPSVAAAIRDAIGP